MMQDFDFFENDWIGFEDETDCDEFCIGTQEEIEVEQVMELYRKKYGNTRIAR
ncbi:MAG: hypothetical protein JW791_01465 [Nanoarchaeota archaeon]|nr:hypothetical protein [Nanoarchaeota archaeon]